MAAVGESDEAFARRLQAIEMGMHVAGTNPINHGGTHTHMCRKAVHQQFIMPCICLQITTNSGHLLPPSFFLSTGDLVPPPQSSSGSGAVTSNTPLIADGAGGGGTAADATGGVRGPGLAPSPAAINNRLAEVTSTGAQVESTAAYHVHIRIHTYSRTI